jgi:hypothetical protein
MSQYRTTLTGGLSKNAGFFSIHRELSDVSWVELTFCNVANGRDATPQGSSLAQRVFATVRQRPQIMPA